MLNAKSLLIVVALALPLSTFHPSEAQAGWIGKEWEKHKKRRKQLWDAGKDVGTFGQHGRDRDKERADAAKKQEEDRKHSAEQAKQKEIENTGTMIVSAKAAKMSLQQFKDQLDFLRSRLESHMKLTSALLPSVSAETLQAEARAQIYELQQQDLKAWMSHIDKLIQQENYSDNNPLREQVEFLRSKFFTYQQQVLNIPRFASFNLDQQLDSVLELGFECAQITISMSSDIDRKISAKDSEIAALETKLTNLTQ